MPRPCRKSSKSAAVDSPRNSEDFAALTSPLSSPCATDWMGARELFSSWPRTRISRCHALRSSSLNVRLRSLRTTRWCGKPPCRKDPRRSPQRPEPPGKFSSMVRAGSPSRQAPSPSSSAVKPRRRSNGRPSKRSPARLTRRSCAWLSNVKMARSISSITVRSSALASSAPRRCCLSVSLSAFTSMITSPMASSLRAPRARNEKSSSRRAASRFESVCREKTTRERSEKANPSQRETIRKASVQNAPEEKFPVHSRMSAISEPGRPAASARSWMRRSYDSCFIPIRVFAVCGTWRCGLILALLRPG